MPILMINGSSSLCVVNRSLTSQLLSTVMRTKSKWSPGPSVNVLGISLESEASWLVSAVAKPIGICPDCRTRSRYRHGWRKRTLQDLPVQGQVVKVQLALNRWQCRDLGCQRRTFTDRLPEIASPHSRRTARMAAVVDMIGHSMGGRPAEYLMGRLGMPISDDTILRQIKRRASTSNQDANIRHPNIKRAQIYGSVSNLRRYARLAVYRGRLPSKLCRFLMCLD